MHKFISIILGGLIAATSSFSAQVPSDALARKQGGADTRLQKQMLKRSKPTGKEKRTAAAAEPLLARKQGGADTRLQKQMLKRSKSAGKEKRSDGTESRFVLESAGAGNVFHA